MLEFSHKKLPITFNNYFNRISEFFSHTTRHVSNNNIFLPHVHTSRSQRSIKYVGAKIRNNISSEIKNLPFHKFEEIYKNFFLHNYNAETTPKYYLILQELLRYVFKH